MPSKSRAQQRLFQAAEHGANFEKAREIRGSMTMKQMSDFATGSMQGKPEHVTHAHRSHGMRAAHASHPHASRLGKFLHPKKSR
jgi:hypothetical protein